MSSTPRQSQAQSAALALPPVVTSTSTARFTPEQVNQIVEARLAKARRQHQAEVDRLQLQVTQLQAALAARGPGSWSGVLPRAWWARLRAMVRRTPQALGVRS